MDAMVERSGPLSGTLTVPGDKSISHRAVMCAALAQGTTRIEGFLAAEDCRRTIRAFQAWGVPMTEEPGAPACPAGAAGRQAVAVEGRGTRGLAPAAAPIDAGNSGTTMRLLAGMAAGQSFATELTGDASLQARPMRRIVEPLERMGARIAGRELPGRPAEIFPPLLIHGQPLRPLTYTLPVASAQVKSAILLAALYAPGATVITEPQASRDHTERMLRLFGVEVRARDNTVTLHADGSPLRSPGRLVVPGDLSSAAFWLVACSIIPTSALTLEGVGLNPTRTGVLDILRYMGAAVSMKRTQDAWEPRGTLLVKAAELRATVIKETLIPRTIDELPILMVAATQAKGITELHGIEELRVKETDRVHSMVEGLSRMGAKIGVRRASELPAGAPLRGTPSKDAIVIEGPSALHGAVVDSFGDHRTAMSLVIAGLVARGTTQVRGVGMIPTSYPGFFDDLRRLGAAVTLEQ